MVKLSKNALLRFKLDGQAISAPVEWSDIQISAVFENDSVQPSIETSEFTFVNAEAKKIRDYIDKGLTGGVGIFEGLPFKIETYNKDNSLVSFDGFLELTNSFQDFNDEPRVSCRIMKDNGLDSLESRLSGLTCGYLEEIGVIKSTDYEDLKYQVQKKVTVLEVLIANITLFLLIKELAQAIKDTAHSVAIALGDTLGSLTGGIGAAAYLIAYAILQLIYTATLIVAIVELVRRLVNILLPPLRTHKIIKLKTLLEIISTHLGYTFNTNISELDNLYYLPSNNNLEEEDTRTGLLTKIDGTDKGIPNSVDFGYNCAEIFSLARQLFNAKFVIVGSTLHMRFEGDPFWAKTSTYQMPSVLLPVKTYNTNELDADILLSFQVDLKDSWTIDNYKGTAYEVKTDSIITNNKRAKLLRGQNTVDFPVCLGNRKDEFTAIENILFSLASFADKVTKVLGKGTNLAGLITRKLGVLKQSENETSLPKLLYLNSDNKLPSNHRDLFSAKVLWDKYWYYKSFVDSNFVGQKIIYPEVKIPFGLEDFIKLVDNSYFRTFEGETAKAISIKWSPSKDFALIDFFIRKPYTKNLQQTKIEPE